MFWETKKDIVWLTLLQYLIYWGCLEPNPQYLQGMPVCDFPTIVYLVPCWIFVSRWTVNLAQLLHLVPKQRSVYLHEKTDQESQRAEPQCDRTLVTLTCSSMYPGRIAQRCVWSWEIRGTEETSISAQDTHCQWGSFSFHFFSAVAPQLCSKNTLKSSSIVYLDTYLQQNT